MASRKKSAAVKKSAPAEVSAEKSAPAPFLPDALAIRTTSADGEAYGGFIWPREVGAIVEAPDWKPTAACGNGLHGVLDGDGNWSLLSDAPTALWWLVEVVRSECVAIDDEKVKFPRCRVKYVGHSGPAIQEILAIHRELVRTKISNAVANATESVTTAAESHASASGWSGHASASGDSGHASASGDSGHASASGDSGHASASGWSGHASASGVRGHASASGVRGHASASGDSGHASASGWSGHASASGVRGHASASGWSGHASASGVRGHASASGDSGHASASGWSGHASASGDSGHASASGDSGHASASGDSGHASASGWSGHASASGWSGHASASGDSGHASASGKQAIAAAFGADSRARAGNDGWIVCTAWHKPVSYDSSTWSIACVKAAKVGGPEGIKANTWYALTVGGVFVEVPDGE